MSKKINIIEEVTKNSRIRRFHVRDMMMGNRVDAGHKSAEVFLRDLPGAQKITFTRYSFEIEIGLCFTWEEVRSEIRKIVAQYASIEEDEVIFGQTGSLKKRSR